MMKHRRHTGRALAAVGYWCQLTGVPADDLAGFLAQVKRQGVTEGKVRWWQAWIACVATVDLNVPAGSPSDGLAIYLGLKTRGVFAREGAGIRRQLLDCRFPVYWLKAVDKAGGWPDRPVPVLKFHPVDTSSTIIIQAGESVREIEERAAEEAAKMVDIWTEDAKGFFFHPSHLEMMSKCGLQFFFRYDRGIRRPPAARMIRGSAGHASIEANLEHKMATQELLPLNEAEAIAADTYEHLWSVGVSLTDDEKSEGTKTVKGRFLDGAVKAARVHHQKRAPELWPVFVEKYFKIKVPGRPWGMAGTIDIVESDAVWDNKITGKSPSKGDADSSIQLTGYGIGKKVLLGRAPDRTGLDYIVTPKVKDAYHKPIESSRGPADYQAYLKRCQRVYAQLQRGVFLPAPAQAWWCSKTWCGYWDLCPFGARGRIGRR